MTWKQIEGFPNYEVSEEGLIRQVDTQRIRAVSRTQAGACKVTLFINGMRHTRSVPLIVAKAHVYNDHDPKIFETPIHLNNDIQDNRACNLAWRPRWFAVKYQQQYWLEAYRHATTRVVDVDTGDIYESLVEVCQRYGFLYIDVIKSCDQQSYVFPTWRKFAYL